MQRPYGHQHERRNSEQEFFGNREDGGHPESGFRVERSFDEFREARTSGDERKTRLQFDNIQASYREREPYSHGRRQFRRVGYFFQRRSSEGNIQVRFRPAFFEIL